MDFDLFFSSPRWRILEILAKQPSSPLEISEKLGTSVSYVSQQLKLLEAGNLVVKERTGSAEKGKARTVFSLSKEILQLTVLMNKLPFRKLIYLTDYHKLILRIWLLENPNLHYYVEKLYWKIEGDIDDIKGIFIDGSLKELRILVVSDSKKLKPKIDSFLKETDKKLNCLIVSESDLKKISGEGIHPIYDPKFLFLGKKLKGGDNKQNGN